jgi:YVTN family beta-propeller protein
MRPISTVALVLMGAGIICGQPQEDGRTKLPVGSNNRAVLPTGQVITPTAVPGSTMQQLATGLRADGNANASQAVKTALSPDGKTLLVLTSGWNKGNVQPDGTAIRFPLLDPTTGVQSGNATTPNSEWILVFAMNADGSVTSRQVLNTPSTYNGMVWAPDGTRFYVSGGTNDRVLIYKFDGKQYSPDAPFILLGHNSNQTAPTTPADGNIFNGTPAAKAAPSILGPAIVAGMDISADGKTLVAANFENDSISICDTGTRTVIREVKFFTPGGTVAQGEFPYDVAVKSNPDGSAATAFVTSQRDGMVMVVNVSSGAFTSIAVGDQPNRLALSADQKTLYVVNGNSDSISVIDAAAQNVVQTIPLSRPFDKYKGANPNSVTLSPDGHMLYATLGFENAVAVVDLRSGHLTGRIPTGWYPTSVSVSKDGTRLYVCTFKSNSGPNPANTLPSPQHLQGRSYPMEKSQLHIIPMPDDRTLAVLSEQVDRNNGLKNRQDNPKMAFLRNKINHVIYIVKENKTFDQVLGDLSRGNGDPTMTQFPQAVSPNHHQLALTFGLLDNFYATGEVSGVGWSWSTWGNSTDYNEKTIAVNYGNGGPSYDAEGTSRLIGVGLPQSQRLTALLDPSGASNVMPGTKNVDSPSGAGDTDAGAVGGYIWDSAMRGGKSVRNYGFFLDGAYYLQATQTDPTKPDPAVPFYLPVSGTPFAKKMKQAVPIQSNLLDKTDIYYRGFDMNQPDQWLVDEWLRDVGANGLPNLSLVRLPHDHFGSSGTAVGGLRTPTQQMADNDYALGRIVEWVSHSNYWADTAIFVVEDDAQSGSDHIDSHRSPAFVISPYARRGVTVSTNYNTISVLRTMGDLLGIDHIGLADANAAPMADLFSETPDPTPYVAVVPGTLCAMPVDTTMVPACGDPSVTKTLATAELHDAAWWAEQTKDLDFHDADRIDAEEFNHILWRGIMGDHAPYPAARSGADLSKGREKLLLEWKRK